MTTRTTILTASLLTVSVLACGDDSGGSIADASSDASGDATSSDASLDGSLDATLDASDANVADASLSPIAQGEFAASFAQAFCQAVRPCCERVTTYNTDCVATVTTEVEALLSDLSETSVYDANHAANCVATLEGLPQDCVAAFEDRGRALSACQLVINGNVEPGEVCESLSECAAQPGATGNREVGYVGCLPFDDEQTHCRHFQPAHLGEPCSATVTGGTDGVIDACTSDLYCDEETSTCKALPQIGQPCMYVGNSGPCGEGFCDQQTDTCTALRAENENCEDNSSSCDPCGGHDTCEERYTCDEGTCAQDDLVRFFGVAFGHIGFVGPAAACEV